MANTRMYEIAAQDDGNQGFEAARGVMNLSQLAMQNKAFQRDDALKAHKQKLHTIGNTMEVLAGMPEQERMKAYPGMRNQLVQSGVLGAQDAPEQYDPDFFRQGYANWRNSDEYLERQKQVAETELAKQRAAAAVPDAKLAREKAQLEIQGLRNSLNNPKKSLSPGEEKIDETFGKEAAEYHHGGGQAGVEKNIAKIESAIDRLKGNPDENGKPTKSTDLTGGLTTKLPWAGDDAQQDWINPDLAAVRDDIRGAIQTSLKQILGGQFTEKEAIAMFNRAFNPRLSPAENVRRAQLELENLRGMAASKDQAMAYFQKNGTLKGFKARPTNVTMHARMSHAEFPQGGGGGIGMNEAYANEAPPMTNQRPAGSRITAKELEEYATKHNMTVKDAKAFLGSQGYAAD